MGYSVSVDAVDRYHMVLDKDTTCLAINTWMKGDRTFMVEIGRKQRDGAVTGTVSELVYSTDQVTYAYRRGSMRIDRDGKVVRWPHLSKAMRDASKQPLPPLLER